MKALTLTQPWASLVAMGLKRYETRSWATRYRGPLAIHAATGYPREARALLVREPFCGAFRRVLPGPSLLPPSLPTGAIVAVCRLVRCAPTAQLAPEQGDEELAFGDWAPGRYAWELADVRELDVPIAARGALGLWEWSAPPAVLRELGQEGG